MITVEIAGVRTTHTTGRVADRKFTAAKKRGVACAVLMDGRVAEAANGYPGPVDDMAALAWMDAMVGGRGIGSRPRR